MKIAILFCTILAIAMPNMARAEQAKFQTSQANCRIVGIKIIRTVDGENVAEYIIRSDVSSTGQIS